jgi:hypothetical protein
MEVRPGHLDVVAEDPVVADLERADAGALPLAGLERGDDALPVLGELDDAVQATFVERMRALLGSERRGR